MLKIAVDFNSRQAAMSLPSKTDCWHLPENDVMKLLRAPDPDLDLYNWDVDGTTVTSAMVGSIITGQGKQMKVIRYIATHPLLQMRGFGRALVDALEDRFRECGVNVVVLQPVEQRQEWWSKRGYRSMGDDGSNQIISKLCEHAMYFQRLSVYCKELRGMSTVELESCSRASTDMDVAVSDSGFEATRSGKRRNVSSSNANLLCVRRDMCVRRAGPGALCRHHRHGVCAACSDLMGSPYDLRGVRGVDATDEVALSGKRRKRTLRV